MESYDVIIGGGGVAGLSAAIFLARAGLTVALFDQAESSLYRVSKVNNYLGFPDGVSGPELLELGKRQAQRFGAKLFNDRLDRAEKTATGFIAASGSTSFASKYFILASNKRTDLATGLGLQLVGHNNRFVAVDADGQTRVPGCYAVGRITELPSQAVVSAGDGARVAIGIIQKVRGGYYVDHDT